METKLELAKEALHKIANRFDHIDAEDSFWAYIEDIGDVLHSEGESKKGGA